MSTPSIAQMLATMLYGKRFFPYYTYNLLGGIDEDGKGCIFSFDPVGSYEREFFRAAGTATSTLLWTIFHAFLSSTLPHTRHGLCSTPCPC